MMFKGRDVHFDQPKVMGILNVTPDSFSDGGQFNNSQNALRHAQTMVEQGASFIDIGGESTRPGAKHVSVQQELDRVIPTIELINNELDTIISIDTSKPEVMLAAVNAGASMINDVRALTMPGALDIAAKLAKEQGVPCCIMHMQGQPENMQNKPIYENVVDELLAFFGEQIKRLTDKGFTEQQIVLDPGFGFGKTIEHNYQILKHLNHFTQCKLPILAGISRKSMIGNVLNKDVNERLAGDIAAHTIAAMHGANIIRVHDVQQASDAMKIVNMVNTVN